MNRLLLSVVAGALVSIGSATSACAQVIYATGFEDPPFVADSQLVGQDGWAQPAIPAFLNPGAAVVSTALPRTGAQSVEVLGQNMQTDDFISTVTGGYYHAIGSYTHAIGYDAGPNGKVRVHADIYVSGPTTPGTNFFSASIASIGGDGSGLGELAISSDGQVHAYSSDDLVPAFLFSAPVSLGTWHSLAIEDDFAGRTSSFFVDDVLLGTSAFVAGENPGDTVSRATMIAYAAPESSDNHRAEYAAYFDNYSVAAVPEPASAMLFAVGAIGLGVALWWRRQKQ
jgi:PEP-CTERM motif